MSEEERPPGPLVRDADQVGPVDDELERWFDRCGPGHAHLGDGRGEGAVLVDSQDALLRCLADDELLLVGDAPEAALQGGGGPVAQVGHEVQGGAGVDDRHPQQDRPRGLGVQSAPALAAYPHLVRLVEPGLHLLTRLEQVALRDVVEGPARLAGLLLEPGLVDGLVRDVAEQPGALPLLAHALRQTWERREGRTLTVSGYQASGGIQGAVAQSAERVYRDLTTQEQSALRDLLLRLVTPSPGREPVLSRMPRHVVAPDDQRERIVERLVLARLLTRDQGAVEIAHVALVRAWPRLRRWLADDLQGQLLWHHLTDSSLAWDASGRPEDELYRGARLAATSEWEHRTHPSLTQVERDFLDSGRTVQQRQVRRLEEEAERQSRSVRLLRVLTAAVAVVALVATFLGASAVRQADRADAESLRARAHELAASSMQALTSDPGLGRTLAVAAAVAGPQSPSVQTSAALHQALAVDQVMARLTFRTPSVGSRPTCIPRGTAWP